MVRDLRLVKSFPRQIWALYFATFIFSLGSSMVWPYLNIYLKDRLDQPLIMTTTLISVRGVTEIISSFISGPIADRFGRRKMMIVSLAVGVVYYYLLSVAGTLHQFILLMAFWGFFNMFYPVGSNAMIADLVGKEQQMSAFSFLRIVTNSGFAIGPIIGGIIASQSYSSIFYAAATGFAISCILLILTIKESLQKVETHDEVQRASTRMIDVFRDYGFIFIIGMSIFIFMGTSAVFNLLSLYASRNFGIQESHIGIVFTVNALMCVTLQIPVIQLIKTRRFTTVLSIGAFLYTIGIFMYSMIPTVAWFSLSMAVMTTGELLVTPTLLSFTAAKAPPDARGRYMGIYSLAHPIGFAIGPVISGYLYDHTVPQAIWWGGAFFCLIATIGYLILRARGADDLPA
jgi:MFS family permease